MYRFFIALSVLLWGTVVVADHGNITKITKSDDEWQSELSAEEYNVLREAGTERPFTHPLNEEKREGIFHCKACDLPLFESDKKYDSGTGWPSFWDFIPDHIVFKKDFLLIIPRTEYHCARCGSHQGHIFKDGPKPTGKRYCNNGTALKFVSKRS